MLVVVLVSQILPLARAQTTAAAAHQICTQIAAICPQPRPRTIGFVNTAARKAKFDMKSLLIRHINVGRLHAKYPKYVAPGMIDLDSSPQ